MKRQGELIKMQSDGKTATPYHFFLFNDALLYAKDSKLGSLKGRYNLHRKFDIGDRVEDSMLPGEASNRITVPPSCEGGRLIDVLDDKGDEEPCFDVITSKKSFTVVAVDRVDKAAWVRCMREALAKRAGQKSYQAVAVPKAASESQSRDCQVRPTLSSLFARTLVYLSIYLSIYLSVCLSVSACVCACACVCVRALSRSHTSKRLRVYRHTNMLCKYVNSLTRALTQIYVHVHECI